MDLSQHTKHGGSCEDCVSMLLQKELRYPYILPRPKMIE